ncbi:nucleotide disphospho-sugar-binding domain-containing protein [Agromyces sp. LHK192]|uniref:nucleotide disphospho-sugar-binding domain-containing protein n=1 Tax=Agromyces sp. LHK192 TaxID=2498704 RepID=UPI000FDAF7B1|nr:nucleotide disphospho-sugar-binding domain-containing protein [Agromyces sp. LHK192]
MRYLLALWDGGGATPPNLGVARVLVGRGHEVVVLGDPTLSDAIAATGASHRTWPTAPQRVSTSLDDDVLKDWEAKSPLGKFARVRDAFITGRADRFGADVAAAIDDAAREGMPFAAVLADGILLGALAAAEARGIPAAALVGSMYVAPSPVRAPFGLPPAQGRIGRLRDRMGYPLMNAMWDTGLRDLNAARAGLGLDPLRHIWEQWDRVDRVLLLTASAFDDDNAPLQANVRYAGPVLEDIPSDGSFDLPPGDGPLVVVGLSSSYMEQRPALVQIAKALATLPVRAVVTTGPAMDPAEVPAAPNVRVVGSAPHGELIPKADVVVTHAGHGTLIKALAAGVPVVCMPFGRDQPDNARRARRHGVAVVLSPRSDASDIATAVFEALTEPEYRDAAVALGERIRAEIASGVLVAELESLGRRSVSA